MHEVIDLEVRKRNVQRRVLKSRLVKRCGLIDVEEVRYSRSQGAEISSPTGTVQCTVGIYWRQRFLGMRIQFDAHYVSRWYYESSSYKNKKYEISCSH